MNLQAAPKTRHKASPHSAALKAIRADLERSWHPAGNRRLTIGEAVSIHVTSAKAHWVLDAIRAAIFGSPDKGTIMVWEDHPCRTLEEVLEVIDRAMTVGGK